MKTSANIDRTDSNKGSVSAYPLFKDVTRWCLDALADELGIPRRIDRLLRENDRIKMLPTPPPHSIAYDSLERWETVGQPGPFELSGKTKGSVQAWASGPYGYTSVDVSRLEFAQLTVEHNAVHWQCDIRDVEGICRSDGEIDQFDNMDRFIEHAYPALIEDISEQGLYRNLAHREIHIGYEGQPQPHRTTDSFERRRWDGRIFLMNDGGSHHFAAARYIAGRMKKSVRLHGGLKEYRLNPYAVTLLTNEFDIFAIRDSELYGDFHDAMIEYGASMYIYDYPAPHKDVRMLLLPKSEKRSSRVAALLKKHGFFDVAQLWAEILKR